MAVKCHELISSKLTWIYRGSFAKALSPLYSGMLDVSVLSCGSGRVSRAICIWQCLGPLLSGHLVRQRYVPVRSRVPEGTGYAARAGSDPAATSQGFKPEDRLTEPD
ncbi:hypothetical protein FBU59_001721 [Linderina macrospora]|uniref:Uncharacterized protein n=1 Tax=Linderina macrospora TaxID=4868 RepID=A0ACC1JD22_9FUNG|nr:hypothetical protein FBU59_001721 [Linderina macrospora]